MGRENTRQQFMVSAIDRVIWTIRTVSRVSVRTFFTAVRKSSSAVRKITLQGLIIVLILVAISLVLSATFRVRDVSFAPILVPEELANIGYSPRVVAQRVIDRMNVVYTESIKSKNDPQSNTDTTMLGHSQPEVDLVFPSVGISINEAAAYLRSLIPRDEQTVTGELLYHKSKNLVSLRLRLDGQKIFEASRKFSDAGMEELFVLGAYELTKRIDPFILALYHYSEEEISKAKEVTAFVLGNLHGSEDYVRTIVLEGVMLADEGQYDESFSAFRMATELDPNYISAYVNWGNSLFEQGDLYGAIEKYRNAVQVDPTDALAYYNWGVALEEQDKLAEAIKQYQRAIQFDRKYAPAYVHWGNALRKQGDPDGAIENYRNAVQAEPNLALAHVNWGTALAVRNDLGGAIEQYRKAVEADPNYALAYFNWGNALGKQGDYEGAVKQFEKAVQRDPYSAQAIYAWSIALANLGDCDGATNMYERARKIDNSLTPPNC